MKFEHRLDEAFGIQTPMKKTLFERKLEELDWRKAIGAAGMGLAALGGAGGADAAPAPVGQAQQLDAPIKPKTADEKAEELVKPLREAYDKEVKVAQDKYNKTLAVELDKATKAGSLDDVKAIKKEMEEPEGDESKWKSPTHKMAAKQFTVAKEAAQKKWDLGINNLVRQLVQKKELEVAEKVKGVELKSPPAASIIGKWKWLDMNNNQVSEIEIKEDGFVYASFNGWNKWCSWELKNDGLVISRASPPMSINFPLPIKKEMRGFALGVGGNNERRITKID